jgi:hypothetical protein
VGEQAGPRGASGFAGVGGLGDAAAIFAAAERAGFVQLGAHRFETGEIPEKNGVLADTILEAREIGLKPRADPGREAVNHPVGFALRLNETMGFEIAEMLGDLHLGFAQQLLEVADTERTMTEQIENPEPGAVAEALVDLDQFHWVTVEGVGGMLKRDRGGGGRGTESRTPY